MSFVDTIDVEGLGNRGYLAGGERTAMAVDPSRDVDRILAAAARRGVRISHVVETHLHNDYVTGGPELARLTGAAYLVPDGARVSFARVPVADGDTVDVDRDLTLTAVATPGHTPHHTAYVLSEAGRPVAAFTGGSLLIGTVGRPDLVEPRLTEELARAQHASAHRLARSLPDETAVLPAHGFGSFCSSAPADGRDHDREGEGRQPGRPALPGPAATADHHGRPPRSAAPTAVTALRGRPQPATATHSDNTPAIPPGVKCFRPHGPTDRQGPHPP